MKRPLRILHLEDNVYDAELIQETLFAEGFEHTIICVDNRDDFMAAVEQGDFEVILADFALPAFNGLDALNIAQEKCPDVPFIFVSGAIGEEKAIEILRQGATDYVLKHRLSRLGPAIHRALREVEERRERQQAVAALAARARQQAAVAELGQQALLTADLPELMNKVVTLLAEVLEIEYSKVLQYLPDDETLLLIAGVGWRDGLVGQATVEMGPDTQAGYALLADGPVVVDDLSRETRFHGRGLLRDHGVVSGVSVVIPGVGRPFGILGVHTAQRRTFTEDDINFVQSIAHVLATAIERKQRDEQLRQSRNQLEAILQGITEGITVQTPDGRLIYANQTAAQIIGYPSVQALLEVPVFEFAQKFELMDEWGNPYTLEQLPGELALKGGFPDEVLVRFRAIGKDDERWSVIGATPIFDEQGQVQFAVNIFRDVTERTRLYEAEKRARQQVEAAAERTASLQTVTAALSQALMPDQVAQIVVEQGVRVLEARAGSVVEFNELEGSFHMVYSAGYEPGIVERWEHFSASTPIPLTDVVRTGKAIFLESPEIAQTHYPALTDDIERTGNYSWAAIPLMVEGRAIGALGLSFARPRHFPEEDRTFMVALGRQCAQALERTRLYEAEKQARAEAEAAHRMEEVARQRLDLLAGASAILASSLEYQRTLSQMAQLVVPRVADWCAVLLTGEGGAGDLFAQPVAVAHSDPDKVSWAYELLSAYPIDPDAPFGLATVLRTGRSEFYLDFPMTLREAVDDVEHAEFLRRSVVRSLIVAPLKARDRVVGALLLATAESGRLFSAEDLAMAEDLAQRAALAVDNARLYWEASSLNIELEQRVRERTAALEISNQQLQEANAQLEEEIFERERAEERLRHEAARTAALVRTAARLNKELDLETVLNAVCEETAQALNVEVCTLSLYDEREDALVHTWGYGLPEALDAKLKSMPQPLHEFGTRPTGLPFITHDIQKARELPGVGVYRQLGVRSLANVSLMRDTQLVGQLNVASVGTARRFGDDELALLQGLAEQAALAISNAREVSERARAEETIRSLLRISEKLNATLDVDELLDILMQEAIQLIGTEGGAAGLRGPEGIVCRKRFYKGEAFPVSYTFAPGHGVPGWLMKHKVPYLSNNAEADENVIPALRQEWAFRSLLSTPILDNLGEVIGFFEVVNKVDGSGFTHTDQEKLMSVSQVAAVAIQNALAYGRIQEAEAALRQETEFVQLLQRLAVAANEAMSFEAALQFALEQICTHTGWPVGHVYLVTRGSGNDSRLTERRLVPADIWHLEEAGRFEPLRRLTKVTVLAPGEGLPGRVLESGKPAWLVDKFDDASFPRRQVVTEVGLRTGFAFPALVGTEVAAVLEFFTTEAVKPDKALLEVTASIGTQLGRVIERSRAAEALRQSESLYRLLAQNLPNGSVALVDKDLRYRLVEGASLARHEIFRQKLEGKTLWEALPAGLAEARAQQYREALAGNHTTVEVELDGYVYLSHSVPIRNEEGEIYAAMVLSHDITRRKEAEEKLRKSQMRLAEAQKIARLGSWEWETTTDTLIWSEEMYRIFGLRPEEFAGTFAAFLDCVHPEDRTHTGRVIQDAYERGEPFDFYFRVMRLDGDVRIIQGRGEIALDGSGNVIGMVGTSQDVTEIKQAEAQLERNARQLAALGRMGQAVAATLDLPVVLKRVLDQVAPLLPAEGLSILLLEQDELYFAATSGPGAVDLEGLRMPATGGVAGRVIEHRRPVWVQDTQGYDHFYRQLEKINGYQIKTLLAVPLKLHGAIIGVMEAVHSRPDVFNQADLQLLEAASNWTAIAIGNARQHEHVQRRLQESESLAAISRALSETLDQELILQRIVRAAQQIIPLADSAVIHLLDEEKQLLYPAAMVKLDVNPADYVMAVGQGFAGQVVAEGEGINVPDVRLDDRHLPLHEQMQIRSLLIAPVRSRSRQAGVISVNSAIPGAFSADDERLLSALGVQAALAIQNTRLFNALAQEKRRLELLYTLSQDLSASLNPRDVADRALKLTMEALEAFRGEIFLLSNDATRLHLIAASGYEEEHLILLDGRKELRLGQGVPGHTAEMRVAVVVPDVGCDEHWLPLPGLDDEICSVAAVPLLAGDTLVGVLSLLSDKPNFFHTEHLPLLQAVATPVALSLQNARLYQAEQGARRVAETLRTANLALSEQLELNVILERLLDHLGELVTYDSACVLMRQRRTQLAIRALRGYEKWTDPAEVSRMTFDIEALANLHRLITTQQGFIIDDTAYYPEWVVREETRHIRNWLGAPLLVDGEVIGVFTLDKTEPGFFTEAHLQLVEALTAQASVAIQNARLLEQVRVGQEQLRRLTQQVVTVQEEERQRLSRELHDEAGQALTALKISLVLIQNDLPPELGEINDRIMEAAELTRETMDQIRLLAQDLRPPSLDTLGLNLTLEGFCRDFAMRTQLSIEYTGSDLPPLPEAVSTTFYRLLQEALTNVARHAQASKAEVALNYDGEKVSLLVADNGQGFDVQAKMMATAQPPGIGLLGMRERLELLGGHLKIEAQPGQGTRLTAYVPLDGDEG